VVEDVVVEFEDAVREPVVAHVLPNVLDEVEFRRTLGEEDRRPVFRHAEFRRRMPTCADQLPQNPSEAQPEWTWQTFQRLFAMLNHIELELAAGVTI